MALGFSTVTVVTDTRRVDLALPSTVPVGEWFPELLRLAGARENGHAAGWVIGPIGGPQIPLDTTLESAGVSDGQVLQLRTADSDGFVAYVDDFVDTVSDRVDEAADRWTNATSTTFTTLVAGAGLLLLLYPTFSRGAGGVLSSVFDLVVAIAVSLAAGMWARRDRRLGAAVLAVAAMAWWTTTGALLGGLFGGTPFAAAFAAVGLAIGGGVLRVVSDGLAGPAAFTWIVGALVLLSGVAVVLGLGLVPVLSVLLGVCVLALGILPLTALGAGGLASMDYRIRAGQRLSTTVIERAVRRASAILMWTLTGIGLLTVASGGYLAVTAGLWPRLLAALAGFALLLRSRAYTRRVHALPVRLAGSAVLAATLARFVLDREPGEILLVVLFAAGLIGFALLSAIRVNDVLVARLRLLGNYAEIGTVILMVPILLQIFGLFAWIRTLIGS
ncbi:MAG: type VII secretion integral membrane protein EccD [Acidothermales bacterium]|nr:type VII secretion integral membrane protein EccD [Acidothermales bacterium]